METVDTSWKGLYRWGGISALLVGVLFIIAIPLYFVMGPQPSGGEAILKYYSSQTTLAYSSWGTGILADVLFVPVVLALYLALKGVNKNAMLTATGFGGLFIALDLGVTTIASVALASLSQNYTAATTDVQRAAYVATANYALAITTVSAPVYSILILSIWLLITALVMLKGIFSRVTAYLGIVASIVGFVYSISLFVPALAMADVIAVVLYVIWLLLVGSRLYKLGKR